MTTYWYRYEDVRHAIVDEWDNVESTYTAVYLHKYPLLKETPKGGWIDIYGTRKFVLLTARKKFAVPTIEQAKESFIARKNAQIRHNQKRIDDAKQAIWRLTSVRDQCDLHSFT